MKMSLFASSVRPQLYESLFNSLTLTEPLIKDIEVIFAGNAEVDPKLFLSNKPTLDLGVNSIFLTRNEKHFCFEYYKTSNIKPAQCYEIARRNCTGEVVVWIADDCEFVGGVLSKAYEYWMAQGNKKLVLSLQVSEYENFCNMNDHCLAKHRGRSELMAPIGMMSREYLQELGGLDRRFICGQYENSIVMRVLKDGGKCEVIGDKDSYVFINHHKAWELSKESKSYNRRPFALGFPNDRAVLEGIWIDNKLSEFEPFIDENLLTVSQGNNLPEMWQ